MANDTRITPDGDTRVTPDGDTRVVTGGVALAAFTAQLAAIVLMLRRKRAKKL